VDHVKALACGGADAPESMQWQTVAEGKAKDKWEDGCLREAAHCYLSDLEPSGASSLVSPTRGARRYNSAKRSTPLDGFGARFVLFGWATRSREGAAWLNTAALSEGL